MKIEGFRKVVREDRVILITPETDKEKKIIRLLKEENIKALRCFYMRDELALAIPSKISREVEKEKGE